VGHSVIVKSDKLSVPSDGVPTGMFQIDAPATAVKVEVLSKAGNVIDTMNLGAQPAGRSEFQWPAGQGITEADGVRFRVTASSGTTALTSTALMQDKVNAVNTSGSSLTLELARSGDLAYSSIVAVN
jgi:flagellar basal-body rod modification protein FlgD